MATRAPLPCPMLPILAMRALALLSGLLAIVVASSAAAGSRSWLQALAKVLFALLLLALARLAWMLPRGRAERARRRVLRLVALVLSEDLRRTWAESTPSTDPDEALLSDLRAALDAPPELLAAAFDAEELALVGTLRAELALAQDPKRGLPALPALHAPAAAIQAAALARARSPVT